MNRKECFLSSLYGHAIGDALGAPLENLTNNQIEEAMYALNIKNPFGYEESQAIRKYVVGSERDILGVHTDDTQYLMVLLFSLTSNSHRKDLEFDLDIDHAVFLFNYLSLYSLNNALRIRGMKGLFRGTGHNARKVFDNYSRGIHFPKASVDSAGIGSAMRIGPIPILFQNEEKLKEFVIKNTLLTHKNSLAIIATYAQAIMINQLYEQVIVKKKDIRQVEERIRLLNKILNKISEFETNLSQEVKKINPSWNNEIIFERKSFSKSLTPLLTLIDNNASDIENLTLLIRNSTNKRIVKLIEGVSGYVLELIPAVFYFVFKYVNDPIRGLYKAITFGGDTDTLGAMVGSALFLVNPYSLLPKEVYKKLKISEFLHYVTDQLFNFKKINEAKYVQLEEKINREIINQLRKSFYD